MTEPKNTSRLKTPFKDAAMTEAFKKNLRNYIEKVISDASKAEDRPNNTTFEAFIVDNSTLFLLVHSQYKRVIRRVNYRIMQNIRKNFGLDLGSTYNISRDGMDIETPDFTLKKTYVEAGYTVAEVRIASGLYFVNVTAVGKKACLLRHGLNGDNPWDACTKLRKQMEAVGGKLYYYEDLPNAFSTYLRDYKAAFGMDAQTVSVELI